MDNATLRRFYSLHFLLPFLIRAIVVVHLAALHNSGSSNPLGVGFNPDKISFSPYFSAKDMVGACVLLFIFRGVCFFSP